MTGGSGSVGTALVRKLRQNFAPASATVIAPRRSELDLLSVDAAGKVLEYEPTHIFHCAADLTASHDLQVATTNRRMIRPLLETFPRIQNLIILGSAAAYQPIPGGNYTERDFFQNGERSLSGYPLDKRESLLMSLRKSKRNASGRLVVLMVPNLYSGQLLSRSSGHQNVFQSAVNRVLKANTEGQQYIEVESSPRVTRQVLHVDDLVGWLATTGLLEQRLPHLLNLGSEEVVSVEEVFRAAVEVLGTSQKLLFEESKGHGPTSRFVDDTLARSQFGWKPCTTVMQSFKQDMTQFKFIE